jgi:hypothetical protein
MSLSIRGNAFKDRNTIESDGAPPSSWPDASNTGYAPGSTLTSAGNTNVTVAGSVIENLNITGQLSITANNVTVRNCNITAGVYGIRAETADGLLIEDCTLVGDPTTAACVLMGGGTLTRCNISGSSDGIKVGFGLPTTISECWVHDLGVATGSHSDCIQVDTADSLTFHHNYLDATTTDANSAILMGGGEDRERAINCTISNNFMNGGGYTFFGPAAPSGQTNVTGGPSVNVQVLNNTFGTTHVFGYVAQWEDGDPSAPNVWSGNINTDGQTVDF